MFETCIVIYIGALLQTRWFFSSKERKIIQWCSAEARMFQVWFCLALKNKTEKAGAFGHVQVNWIYNGEESITNWRVMRRIDKAVKFKYYL